MTKHFTELYPLSQATKQNHYSPCSYSWDFGRVNALPLWIEFVAMDQWGVGAEYQHAYPSNIAFELPVDGDFLIRFNDRLIPLYPGQLFILPAGFGNQLKVGNSGHCRKRSFGICGNLANSLLASLNLPVSKVLYLKNSADIFSRLDQIQRLLHRKDLEDIPTLAGIAYELLVEIRMQCVDHTIPPMLSDILRLMEMGSGRGLKIQEIADNLGISRQQLFLLFRQHMGCSPKKHMMTMRLRFAAELLVQNNCNIEEIAVMTGYRQLSHFSRDFRNYAGCPPLQYRAKYLADKQAPPSAIF